MNLSRTFLFLLLLGGVSGCIVQSLNPYYTKESTSEIQGPAGEWTLLDGEGKPQSVKPWVFSKDEVHTYDKNGTHGVVKAVYFRIGEAVFLDTMADDPPKGMSEWWTMHVMPVHVVTRVYVHEDRLTLTPIDYAWLKKAVGDGVVKLPHILQKEEDGILFTASAEEWTDFLKKYGEDANVFSAKNAIRLIKYKAK